MRIILLQRINTAISRMPVLIIDPNTSGWPRGGKLVDAHPGYYFVVAPGVVVRPIVKFLVDPGEERDGVVVEAVAEGLGLGALD